MPIQPLNTPQGFVSQPIDFQTPLAQLGVQYRESQKRQTLSELGRGLANGTIDYQQAAGRVAELGDLDTTTRFLSLAQAKKKLEDEQAASSQFSMSLANLYGGGGQPQATAPTAMPQRAMVPVSAGATPQALPLESRAPVQSSPRVWGDDEAVKAGLYDPPANAAPMRVAQAPAPAAAPVASPSAAAQPVGVNQIPILLQATANPRLPAAQKELAGKLLTRALDEAKTPEKIQTLKMLKEQSGYQGSILELEMELRRSGKTEVNVNTKGETKFEEKLAEGQAKRFNDYISNGAVAQRKLVDINSLREISQRMGSQGAAANIKESLGPYAEAVGVNINGLSDIQAYSSIIQRLAPQQRAEGSGSTSDIEFKGFLKGLPTLSQNPAARDMTINTMEALTRDEVTRGEIATQLATGEIKRGDAEKRLRALPDPMQGFFEWRKSNAAAYGQAIKGGGGSGNQTKTGVKWSVE